jgi:hypothetical protein
LSEKIFLTYSNATALPYQGSVLGYHVVLNYIDSNGKHHTLQGVPEQKFEHNIDKLRVYLAEEYGSDGTNNTDSPFKRLRSPEESRDDNVSLDRPYTIVAEDDDLSSRWALMKDFADEVNSIGYEYRPTSQNSNSFAGGALQRGGFLGPGNAFPERFDHQLVFDPASGETHSYRVPGFDMPLSNPINTATPMPFPLSALAPPLVPANSLAAPERPASLDNHFGNWGDASPTGDTDNPPSPVLRELQKYKRPARVDAASPWAQTAVRTSPQIRRISSAFRDITAENPNQPVPPTEPTPLLGIFSGKPMSLTPLPPSVLGLPDSSDKSDGGNWFTRLAGTPSRTPQRPAQSPLDDLLREIYGDGTLPPWLFQRQSSGFD